MAHEHGHDHDGDTDHKAAPMVAEVTDFEILEIAVRELAIEKGLFTAELLKQATRVGFEKRTKVHIAWLGSTLRLEARERRLELRPTAAGIQAVYLEDGTETRTEPLDTSRSAEDLVRHWLS